MIINSNVINKLKNRDEKTFEAVYKEFNNLIYYICYSITYDKAASEDLTQDTFLKLLVSLDSYQDDGKFKQFITEIARNLALNYVTRISNYEGKLPEEMSLEETVSNEDDHSNMLMLELQGLLSQEESDIVILKIVYDYKFKEIAEYKSMTLGEVQAKYYKALDKVKDAYKKGEISL